MSGIHTDVIVKTKLCEDFPSVAGLSCITDAPGSDRLGQGQEKKWQRKQLGTSTAGRTREIPEKQRTTAGLFFQKQAY